MDRMTDDEVRESLKKSKDREAETWERRRRLIMTTLQLMRLATSNECVVVQGWERPVPARWVVNMSLRQVHSMIFDRRIWTYAKKGSRPQPNRR